MELNLVLLSVNPEGTKPLDTGHINKEYSNKLHKKLINNISIKFKYAKTVKDISRKFKNTGNKRRSTDKFNDKDTYGERQIQMNISKCQIDTYHNMTNIYRYIQF